MSPCAIARQSGAIALSDCPKSKSTATHGLRQILVRQTSDLSNHGLFQWKPPGPATIKQRPIFSTLSELQHFR